MTLLPYQLPVLFFQRYCTCTSKYFFYSRIQRSPEDAKLVNLVMTFGFATKTNTVFESSLKQQQQQQQQQQQKTFQHRCGISRLQQLYSNTVLPLKSFQ